MKCGTKGECKMQDFDRYSYVVKSPDDLVRMISEVRLCGLEPLLIINGEYYSFSEDFTKEKGEEKK
jgi:hypothetical protein